MHALCDALKTGHHAANLEYEPGYLYSSITVLQCQTGPGQWLHVRWKRFRRGGSQLRTGFPDPKTGRCVGVPHPWPHDSVNRPPGRMVDEGEGIT